MKPNTSEKSDLAIPLISYSQTEGFVFNPEAEKFLYSIPEEKKVGAISIVGKYRTGKSFFVNEVLLQVKKGGFKVGPTVNPCTKGLWIWKKTIPSKNPEYPDLETLVIDTQGFGGVDETNTHDSRIFLFSLLLSSYFIYNSMNTIDQNALNTLNVIINLATSIQKKGGSTFDISMFPSFLWVVRDFSLQLVNKKNQPISQSQYLQNSLEEQPQNSNGAANKNKIRRQFKNVFPERDCITMICAFDGPNLRSDFQTCVKKAQQKIFNTLRPKSINGQHLNGARFVDLIKGYIDIVNKGDLPTIQSTFVYLRRGDSTKAASESIRKLEGRIQQQLTNHGLLDQKQIPNFKAKLESQTLKNFRERLMNTEDPDPQVLENLQKKMRNLISQFVERNKKGWEDKFIELSQQVVQQLRNKIFKEQYKDYDQFLQDFNRIKQAYEKSTGSNNDKWVHFNQISGSLHRLAQQAIMTKITNKTKMQNEVLQKKIELRQNQFNQRRKQLDEQKYFLKQKIQELERQLSRSNNSQALKQQTIKNLRQQNSKLKQKLSSLQFAIGQKEREVSRINSQNQKISTIQMEQTRSELRIMRSNLDKQKSLQEMQKQFHEKQIQSYKEKITHYEAEMKRLKSNNGNLSNENQQLKYRLEELQQKQIQDQELIDTYKQKVEHLVLENDRKSDMANDQRNWLQQKSYLENQVSFLKNTVNDNKRLHDALMTALQQSVSTIEGDGTNSLVETNKNLSAAMQKLQTRCRLLQQKCQKLKRFKKIVKNCTALQCLHCLKWIANAVFPQHLLTCANESPQKIKGSLKQNSSFIDLAGLHILINQTVINETQQNKPFTQYLIQLTYYQKKWTVNQKFKSFCQFNHHLKHSYPAIKLPESSSVIINADSNINDLINSKKTAIAVEERRKALQQYMRDLSKIDVIRNSEIYRTFIKFDEHIGYQDQDQNIVTKSAQKIFNRQVASSMAGTKKDSKLSTNNYSGLKSKKH